FFTCVFAGYIIKPKAIVDEVESSSKFKSKKLYTVMIKYIAPIFIIMIFFSSILKGLGIIDF
ncbi:MAG: sodium-dependent transporter, partial [Lachnospiraceae bacterium]|nr:sodium-dependent transporter [Lachnospiraceae bacterium]